MLNVTGLNLSYTDEVMKLTKDCQLSLFRGFDMGCFVKQVCDGVNAHIHYIGWLLVLVPLLVYIITIVAYRLERNQRESFGESLFKVKYLDNKRLLCVGWESYKDFELFCFRELALFMMLCGGVLLYMIGVFSWIRL